jgi:hypothetical protein
VFAFYGLSYSDTSQGKAWAAHINEPWHTLVLSGGYIFVSVTFGVPLFTVLAAIVVSVLRGAGVDLGKMYHNNRHNYTQ